MPFPVSSLHWSLRPLPKAEGLEGTDADVDDQIREVAEQNKMEFDDVAKTVDDDQRKSLKEQIAIDKAVTFIMDNAKERAKAKRAAKEKMDDAEERSRRDREEACKEGPREADNGAQV